MREFTRHLLLPIWILLTPCFPAEDSCGAEPLPEVLESGVLESEVLESDALETTQPAISMQEVFQREKDAELGQVPISMTVVINLFDPFEGVCYGTDGEAPFFLSLPNGYYQDERLATGQRVQITGVYDFRAHVVRVSNAKILDESVELAKPREIDFSTVILGDSWCDRVSVKGKVKEVCVSKYQSWLVLENDEYQVRIVIARVLGKTQGQNLLGSLVQVVGIMDYETGPDSNPNAMLIRTDSKSEITTLRNSTTLPNKLPLLSTLKVAEVESDIWFRLRGQSTYSTKEFLFLEGENGKLIFNGHCCDEIYRDAIVEVIGRRDSSGKYQIGCVHQGSMVTPRSPLHLSLHAISGVATPERYTVSGQVEAFYSTGEERAVVLTDSGNEITLLFPASDEEWEALQLRKGLRLSVPGLLLDSVNKPLELLVTEAEAIEVQPDWVAENSTALKNFAIVALCLLMFAGLWVFLLRRQVRYKTQHLSEITARLNASHEAIKEGIATVAPQGQLLELSSLFRKITGLHDTPIADARELFSQLQNKVIDHAAFEAMTFGLLGDQTTTRTLEFQLVDSSATYIVLHTAPVVDREDKNRVISRIWAVEDISSRKELEKSLVQSRKMEAIGRFAGGIAHDFNNLLMTISGNIELARDEDSEFQPAGAGSHLEAAEHAADQASKLVHQLLHFSKETPIQAELVNLNEIARSLLPLLKSMLPKTIDIEFNFDDDLRSCLVNVAQLHRVILNLCMNARDAIGEEQGRIVIETCNILASGNPSVQLAVVDDGCGIPSAVIDQIFEPLFSTKTGSKNCGLGLSICYTIAKQHSGSIDCTSELGTGSRFEFRLPCRAEKDLTNAEASDVERLLGAENVETALRQADEELPDRAIRID